MLVAGCTHESTSYLAVSWTGDPPAHCSGNYGPMEAVQRLPIGGLIAVKPGDTKLTCRDGNVTLRVVDPTTLAILSVGTVAKGTTFVITGAVSANGRGLALGDTSIVWTLPPGLRQAEACTKGSCVKPSSTRVAADAAGTYVIHAQLAALTASATVVVN
jgi:hypothetical protein